MFTLNLSYGMNLRTMSWMKCKKIHKLNFFKKEGLRSYNCQAVSLHILDQHHQDKLSRWLSRNFSHAQSTAWAPPSTEAVSSWEFPIHCGLGQQGYGKGRLTPHPARGRHGHCALDPVNYITLPVSSIFSQLFTCWFFQHFSVSSEKKPMSESVS